jgi:hypothetical protein
MQLLKVSFCLFPPLVRIYYLTGHSLVLLLFTVDTIYHIKTSFDCVSSSSAFVFLLSLYTSVFSLDVLVEELEHESLRGSHHTKYAL